MNIRTLARQTFWTLMSLAVTALILICIAFFYLEIQLPNVATLNNIQLQVPLKIYTSDGQLIGEFGEIRRSPVPLTEVPKQLIDAVLATEDQRYYEHPGVDIFGIFRATRVLILTGKKSQGASTITMQVARNFFLSRRKTFGRKFNEMLLALKIDHDLSKEKILELYLNQIYLGQRAYGVAAAAQVYYGKNLNQLTLPEMAMIAGLPQAPSRDNPIVNPLGALDRRNHVLQRMYELGFINKATFEKTILAPNTASYHGQRINVYAPYVAEMVRAAIYTQYGESAYISGFKVYTTLDSHLQTFADQSLRDGLIAYDMRHGYRGPEKNLGNLPADIRIWRDELAQMPVFNYLKPAAIIKVNNTNNSATALLGNGQFIQIPWSGLSWARRYINNQYVGAAPQLASNVVKVGDIVRVQLLTNGQWQMVELPKVEGAIVSLNPNTGQVLALAGGFSFQQSHFNRVIQAVRQPGSNFKPFIYSAALDKGYTLASTINDAPLVENDAGTIWRPVNAELKFNGPTRLRIALIESYNLATIRLLRNIGVKYTLNYLTRFGFDPAKLPHSLSLALGSGGVTPLQIVNGYAVFANGGYRITPYLINQVVNGDDQIIYKANLPTVCDNCSNPAPRVITPQNAYLITNALQDVIKKGTGEGAAVLKRNDVAGKTGTTNDTMDAWFSGFNSDMVATVWIGFDNPESLYEYGARAAIPVWVAFMQQALQGKPENTMSQPPGIVTVKIDSNSGALAGPDDPHGIFEIFTQQSVPNRQAQISNSNSDSDSVGTSTGDDNAVQSLF